MRSPVVNPRLGSSVVISARYYAVGHRNYSFHHESGLIMPTSGYTRAAGRTLTDGYMGTDVSIRFSSAEVNADWNTSPMTKATPASSRVAASSDRQPLARPKS